MAHRHQCLGLPLFAKRCESDCLLQLLGFLPVCLIHPSFHVALLGAREWHCFTSIHVTPFITNIQIYPLFSFSPPSRFAGYLPVNMLCTSWTCLSLSQKFVYIHLHFCFIPHLESTDTETDLLPNLWHASVTVIVSRHAAPLFCILGGKTQVCNINFLLKTT